jgi:hypothetical protein
MIRLTPETLAAAYDYLATMPPFDEWNLPDSGDIKFKVAKHKTTFGWTTIRGETYDISISGHCCRRHQTLISIMAHEMIHVHQASACFMKRNVHDAAFWLLADEVCQHHPDFDRAVF